MYLTLDKDNSNQYFDITSNEAIALKYCTFSLYQNKLEAFTTFSTHIGENKQLGFFKLDQHLNRVLANAKDLGIKISTINKKNLRKITFNLCNDHYKFFKRRQKVRIICRIDNENNYKLELSIELYCQPNKRISLVSFSGKRKLAHIKHTDISISLRANKDLNENEEALFIDQDNNILEAAWSNVFMIKDNNIYTTKKDILPGIARSNIVELFNVKERSIALEEIKSADEIFISKSTSGISIVKKIDSTLIKSSTKAKELIKEFNRYIMDNLQHANNGNPKHHT